ncbi:hypothetical protein M5D96_010608, partial [Drosophila gunungcola]
MIERLVEKCRSSGTVQNVSVRTNIERGIAAVSSDLCLKTVKNWIQRLGFSKR